MYIEPNTTIKILAGVPIDNTYQHTLYFSDTDSQAAYFSGKAIYTFNQQSYQRVERGRMRIQVKADSIYHANYLMFQNTNYGNKWFYAFITSVEYVNNITSEVTFEIDDIQTWFWNAKLQECFVIREHSETDELGDNIEPEPVECGEYVFENYGANWAGDIDLNQYAVVVAIVDVEAGAVDGNRYDGVYGGATLWGYDASDIGGINAKLSAYIQSPDSIIAMYMVPKGAFPDGYIFGTKLPEQASGTEIVVTGQTPTDLDGYIPKNNKLFTYPYSYYHVDTPTGSSIATRYEFFLQNIPRFYIHASITQPVEVTCRPSGYKTNLSQLYTEQLTLNNYPMCSWNYDAYKVWVAQETVPNIMQAVGSAAGTVLSAATSSNPEITVAAGVISYVTDYLTTEYKASIAADTISGSFGHGNAAVANHTLTFHSGNASITASRAKVIDEFFTMFGYATNRVKKPNIDTRPHFNYVKTAGCLLSGNIPAEAERHIENIFDKGITFWKNPNEVGKYSTLDNSPE